MMTYPNQNKSDRRYELSRRTFLRGVGVTMALPWLESIAVWGDEPAATTPPARHRSGWPCSLPATGSTVNSGRLRARAGIWNSARYSCR